MHRVGQPAGGAEHREPALGERCSTAHGEVATVDLAAIGKALDASEAGVQAVRERAERIEEPVGAREAVVTPFTFWMSALATLDRSR